MLGIVGGHRFSRTAPPPTRLWATPRDARGVSAVAEIIGSRHTRRVSVDGSTVSESVEYRSIDPLVVYAVEGSAAGPGAVGPVVGPLIVRLDAALSAAGHPILEPSVFWYESTPGSDDIVVNVSYPAGSDPKPGVGYSVVTLPAIPTAATLLHRGDMSGIGDSWMSLFDQLRADGYTAVGPTREVYLEAVGHDPGPDWVTELQVPVERAR